MDFRKTYKDKEYWEAVISKLTPFEQSALISAIADTMFVEAYELFTEMDPEEVANHYKGRQVVKLIESLAMRTDIVDYLREADKTEWCRDGKILLKSLLTKRKEFLQVVQLKLQGL